MGNKRYPRALLATACVPWDGSNRFDEGLFRRALRCLTGNGIRSIYLFGTAGEGYAVNGAQYREIVRVFSEEMKAPGSLPMVGVISTALTEILERIETGRGLGIRDFQISFPSWGALSDAEAVRFLHEVCGRFPDCRFMHYNNALRSRKRLNPAQYGRIAEEIPNLVAVKFPGPSIAEIHELAALDSPLQFFLLEFAYGYGSLVAEFGLLISLLNISYPLAWKYYMAGVEKDLPTILSMHGDLAKVAQAMFSACPGEKMDGAYDKLFVKFSIPEFPHSLSAPYTGFSDAQFQAFAAALREKVPGWIP